MLNEKTSALYQTRYCAQEDFSIAVCTNRSVRRLEIPFSLDSYEKSKRLGVFMNRRVGSEVVAFGSDSFVINGSMENCDYEKSNFFEKYSESSKNKTALPSTLDERYCFCICSFTQKVYVIGGNRIIKWKDNRSISSCMCYDIKSSKWIYIASMIESRKCASCSVFEGKIVVTGGYSYSFTFNSAESYCFHKNKWTNFPEMLEKRAFHATVSMGNKLFVVGGDYKNDSEVFDSITNKFVLIKNLPEIGYFTYALSIGYKTYVFQEPSEDNRKKHKSEMLTLCYNDKQNAWIKESYLPFKSKIVSCTKLSKK